MQKLPIISYAVGLAGRLSGCALGPSVAKQAVPEEAFSKLGWQFDWCATVADSGNTYSKLAVIPAIAKLAKQLAKLTQDLAAEKQYFAVLGGDHTMAIGTWSGVYQAITKVEIRPSLGMIWIDAHLDSHTPETSISKNVHGMPLACLLGYGDQRLVAIAGNTPVLHPQYVSVVGARSWEDGEYALLEKLKVRIYTMTEIQQRGLRVVMQEARHRAMQASGGYGISLDLDAIDPKDAPGVDSPETNGILLNELLDVLTLYRSDPQLRGLEIAEFNPSVDKDNKTLQAIWQIIASLLERGE